MAMFDRITGIDVEGAAERLRGVVRRTPLVPWPGGSEDDGAPRGGGAVDPRIELRLKLETEQETGAFKARGAWNQLARLDRAARERGVVATSSGNHGRALAWAARRAGVKATLFMPANVYPNKLAACRAEGAEVVLTPDRAEAEERCAAAVQAGATLVHPYDADRTIEGAGTVGLEIAEDWPEVEVVLVPVGGGGLIGGTSLALDRRLSGRVAVIGVEPEGSPNLTRALEEGRPVTVDPITTSVQGLCPLSTGEINLAIAEMFVDGTILLTDEEILAGQRALVRGGRDVEPAGAAAFAAVLAGALPDELYERFGAGPDRPLRVVCVLSGANADPAQLEALRAEPR